MPSSRLDYAALIPQNTFYGEDDPVNLLTDKRDIGKFVAKIVNDERTINQKVFTHSDALSQKAIYAIVEKATGETVDFKTVRLIRVVLISLLANIQRSPLPT